MKTCARVSGRPCATRRVQKSVISVVSSTPRSPASLTQQAISASCASSIVDSCWKNWPDQKGIVLKMRAAHAGAAPKANKQGSRPCKWPRTNHLGSYILLPGPAFFAEPIDAIVTHEPVHADGGAVPDVGRSSILR